MSLWLEVLVYSVAVEEEKMKIKLEPLDILFSRLVRLRADGICEYCGKVGTQTSHFHSRRKRSVRWNLDNACWLCFSCHLYLGEHPNKHYEFFKKRLGTEKFEELNIRAEQITHYSKQDKEAIKAGLKNKIKLLEGKNE